MQIFDRCTVWKPQADSKLQALIKLVNQKHKTDKILVFSQFSDTVYYLNQQLTSAGIKRTAARRVIRKMSRTLLTGLVHKSNKKTIAPEQELRVLVATDVLSDRPEPPGRFHSSSTLTCRGTIIRLIQRAGRVDRIGQKSTKFFAIASCLRTESKTIIRLRAKVRARLRANSEVVGTDESFFDDDRHNKAVTDLYHERLAFLMVRTTQK